MLTEILQNRELTTKIIALSLYVLVLFLIGIVASRRVKNISDYYVGGKKIGYWATAFSARATGESGWLLIGLTGMGALAGLSAYWVVLGEVLGVAVSWQFMAKRFKRKSDKYNSLTVPDYLESHFKSNTKFLRGLAASILSIFVVIYVSTQIDVTGKAFHSMMEMDYYHGALLGFFIVLAYIFLGGFVAVVWSDVFQGVLMFFGLVTLPIVVYYNLDANLNILDTLHNLDPKLTNIWGGEGFWLNLATILGFSMIGLGFLGSPQVYVRFMSIKNEDEIDKGKWVAIFYTLLTDAAAVTIGILARVYFTEIGENPEAVFGIGATDVLDMITTNFLPLGIAAIYVAIVLSAIMSTIDSLLVMASSAVTRDFYQKIFNPTVSDDKLTKISRYVTLIMALLSLGLAFGMAYYNPGRQVFWVMIFGWSGIAASFCPVIILSLFWKAYSQAGAIASIISGFLGVILFKFVINDLDVIGIYFKRLDVLAPSFIVSLLFGWLFTKIYPMKDENIEIK